ncbi:hypothetical protein HL658_03585 [Azospirillum sp. RWY-5-1]|uniref:Uncharacterized protein n=1 Tax=Azospirillum oleiclasticum TaxID=2735135 RepID=A0ABX2T3A1_9PROT|nr:hypothetical protein [Azospirillum oleiclasticum]NYZ11619.1 hypothetical protein [Azospirillum oleiclasticum]NYZ18780.1 hypothetical protein [Azospirillum oleiclasticum]
MINLNTVLSQKDQVGLLAFAAISRGKLTPGKETVLEIEGIGEIAVFADPVSDKSIGKISVGFTLHPEDATLILGWSPDLVLTFDPVTKAIYRGKGMTMFMISSPLVPDISRRVSFIAQLGIAQAALLGQQTDRTFPLYDPQAILGPREGNSRVSSATGVERSLLRR